MALLTDSQDEYIADLHALLGNLPGFVYRCRKSRHWPLLFASDGVGHLCGYSANALLEGRPNWGSLIHEHDRDAVWRAIQQALEEGRSFHVEYRIVTSEQGIKWVCDRGCEVTDRADGEAACIEGFVADITPQKIAGEQIQEQQELLARADRLSMLGEMMVAVAHEINQPLTAISTYAQSALRFLDAANPRPDRLRHALGNLSLETRRAAAVVERIRDFARSRTRRNETIDCNRLVQQVGELATPEARVKGIRIQCQLAGNSGAVCGDAIQLQQLLMHLLRNAIDAMDKAEADKERSILLQTRRINEDLVRIAVVDHSHGISDKLAAELFRPFSTETGAGIGLGLSISRRIASAHGGQLGYENNAGGGATFFVELPRAEYGRTHER